MGSPTRGWLLLGLAVLLAASELVAASRNPSELQGGIERHHKKKKKNPYSSPADLFIQERASKQLPGAGQHFSFGALKPWEDVLAYLDGKPNRKLLLVVRHGQAISNYLSDTLGPDEWFVVEGTCQYDDKQGTIYNIFDADLTGTGQDQAKSLNSMLAGGGWLAKMSGGKPVRAIISPLTRCLHTATLVLQDLRVNATDVEEFVRETLGEDTCDARRSVSDPNGGAAGRRPPRPGPPGPCSFDKGLASTYPHFAYKVHDPADDAERGFGLLGDSDHLWTPDSRERQKAQVKRAKKFLDILYRHAPEPVVLVVTHSGFARSILLAVKREPYRPQNAELIPVLVERAGRRDDDGGDGGADGYDAWLDAALEQEEQEEQQQQRRDQEQAGRARARPQQQQQQAAAQDGCLLRRLARWLLLRRAAVGA